MEGFLWRRAFLAAVSFLSIPILGLCPGDGLLAGPGGEPACSPDNNGAGDPKGGGPEDGDPEEGQVVYRLAIDEYAARRGETLHAVISISNDEPVEMATFSVEFDRRRLQFLEAAIHPEFPAAPGATFEWYSEPGEKWVQGALRLLDDDPAFPPGEDQRMAVLTFRVREDAPQGEAEVRFTTRAAASYQGKLFDGKDYLYNSVRHDGRGQSSEAGGSGRRRLSDSIEVQMGDAARLSILGDVGLFSRGDANGDSLVDVSDPIFLLDFLFMGGPEPISLPAADYNEDGMVNVADPIDLLFKLFL